MCLQADDWSSGRKRARKANKTSHADAVDEDGFLKDIDVQPITEPVDVPKKAASIADINAFFGDPYMKIGASGKPKLHRPCTKCAYVFCSCMCMSDHVELTYLTFRIKTIIINDTTTLRRHLDATHRVWSSCSS